MCGEAQICLKHHIQCVLTVLTLCKTLLIKLTPATGQQCAPSFLKSVLYHISWQACRVTEAIPRNKTRCVGLRLARV